MISFEWLPILFLGHRARPQKETALSLIGGKCMKKQIDFYQTNKKKSFLPSEITSHWEPICGRVPNLTVPSSWNWEAGFYLFENNRSCDMQFIVICKCSSPISLVDIFASNYRPIQYFSRIWYGKCRPARDSFQIHSRLWTCWMSTKSNLLSTYELTYTIKQSTHPAKSYQ